MSELEAEWARRLDEARERARTSGRSDVADYLALRSLNDTARQTGVEWLLARFIAHAGEANRTAGAGIGLTHTDAHQFRVGNSTMVGRRLALNAGVRVLTIEAGWPRTPGDGIVRGGGLAVARISHFGDPGAGSELLLAPGAAAEGSPRWLVFNANSAHTISAPSLEDENVRQHVAKLLP